MVVRTGVALCLVTGYDAVPYHLTAFEVSGRGRVCMLARTMPLRLR